HRPPATDAAEVRRTATLLVRVLPLYMPEDSGGCLLRPRKTVQNDDFGAPLVCAPSGCGNRPPDKRPGKEHHAAGFDFRQRVCRTVV
ncbi:hypothetical protein, partial [Paraburkholderia sp. SIMBA_054]|uniref:hypothetical protein n=1 Tax=Paraburkholderia sp. SIMBA_054 TaxID=3085795 RepID=UPI003978298D